MKFCKYCGKQLNDDALCDCEEALREYEDYVSPQTSPQQNQDIYPNTEQKVNNQTNHEENSQVDNQVNQKINSKVAFQGSQAQSQGSVPPIQYSTGQSDSQNDSQSDYQYNDPQPNQHVPVNGSPYEVMIPPAAKDENKVTKAFKNVPVVFKSFWKNLRQTLNVAKGTKDIAVAIIYSSIFFVSVLLFNILTSLSLDNFLKPFLGWSGVSLFNFPKILLTSFLITVLIGGFFSLILFLQEKVFNKNHDTKNAFLNSFISFSILSIPASMGFILAGLLSFISSYIMIAVSSFTVIYLIMALVIEIKNTVLEITNENKFLMLNALFISIAFIVILFVCLWTTGILDVINAVGNTVNSSSGLLWDLLLK